MTLGQSPNRGHSPFAYLLWLRQGIALPHIGRRSRHVARQVFPQRLLTSGGEAAARQTPQGPPLAAAKPRPANPQRPAARDGEAAARQTPEARRSRRRSRCASNSRGPSLTTAKPLQKSSSYSLT